MPITPDKEAIRLYRQQYELPSRPLRIGGQAQIFLARKKETGEEVIFKRVLDNARESRMRMQREIETQQAVPHPNIMPVLDHSPDYSAYTMPEAEQVLMDWPTPIPDSVIAKIVRDCVAGLAAAHSAGYVHRDLSPSNIMHLGDAAGARWVIGDWGFVKPPPGQTSTRYTVSSFAYGTAGFAAPEMWDSAHRLDARADIYSLGRVVAWAATGRMPSPNTLLLPSNRWRPLVQAATEHEPGDRPERVELLMEFVERAMSTEPPGLAGEVGELLQRCVKGDDPAGEALLRLALDHSEDAVMWFDQVARMPLPMVTTLAQKQPELVYRAVQTLRRLLVPDTHWGNRDFDDWDYPLSWIYTCAAAAAESNQPRLLKYAAESLFDCETTCERFKQRRRTRSWLRTLSGKSAEIVAAALRNYPDAREWYRREGWKPEGAAHAIRSAFGT